MAQGNSEAPPDLAGVNTDQLNPIVLGAQRFLNDEFVKMFFGKFVEMQIANSLFGATVQDREHAREAYKALVAMRDDLVRWASGRISEGEWTEINNRIGQLQEGQTVQ